MFKQLLPSLMNDRRWWWFVLEAVLLLTVLGLAFMTPLSADPLANGGTGPGGVGDTIGSDTLELWLQSDKLVYSNSGCSTVQTTDGNPVGCWRDYSGNNNHAVQATTANQPTFQNGTGDTLNGHPMLRWDGDDILVTTGNVTLGPLSVFIVYNASAEGYLYHHTIQSPPNNGSYIYTQNGASYSVRRSSREDFENLLAGWGISATPRIVTQRFNGDALTHHLYINSVQQTAIYTETVNANAGISPSSAVFSVGGRAVDTALRITGNFAEVIVFNDYLNTAQKILVENYLQAKYNDSLSNNIVLGPSGIFDRYDGDTDTNDNFDIDVAGIGQEGDGSHTIAHSAGMIVEDSTFLQDNGDYLMFGHRSLTNSNVFTELPTTGVWSSAPNPVRWERHWYIDVTDAGTAGGTVDIIFDFNEGGMGIGAPSGPASNYRLLRRADIADDFEDIGGATSVDNILKRVTFTNVSVTDLGSNFTLGSLDGSTSPTVVEMQNAAATLPLSSAPFAIGLALFLLGTVTLIWLRRGRAA